MFALSRIYLLIVSLGASPGADCTVTVNSNEITNCTDFQRGARFNPYEIVDSVWKVFYFWANTTEILYPVIFSLPSKKRIDNLKLLVKAVDPNVPVDWDNASLLMEPRPLVLVLFLYKGRPGAFNCLVLENLPSKVRPPPLPQMTFTDIQIKLVDRQMCIMFCENHTAYALARMDEVPLTEYECEKEARKFNVMLPNQQSHLHVRRVLDEM